MRLKPYIMCILALSACTPQPPLSLEEKLAGKSPAELIDARIAELADWRGALLAQLRAVITAADHGIVEEWKWNVPVWSCGGIVCTGETYKKAVKLTFARGAALADPSGLFNASLEGNVRRAIDFPQGASVDVAALSALALPCATFAAVGGFYDLVRSDALQLGLTTLGAAIAWRGRRDHRLTALAALVLVAAFLTKQTAAPLLVAIGLALLGTRRAPALIRRLLPPYSPRLLWPIRAALCLLAAAALAVQPTNAVALELLRLPGTVVAPELDPELAELAANGSIEWLAGEFAPAQLAGKWLVVAATDRREVNALVYQSANQARIFANVVDDPKRSSFIMPSSIDRLPLMVAISSGGKAPVLARLLREKLEVLLPQHLGAVAAFAGGHAPATGSPGVMHAFHASFLCVGLLSVLAAHAGRVLTHRQLLREVWGPSHGGQNHYLRIYMGHLRQKLEPNPRHPIYILTVHGMGYKFVG